MSPSEYETLVAEIAKRLAESWEGQKPNTDHGRACWVIGKSGFKHQVDIALSWSESLSLVECKRWCSNVNVEKVLAFRSRLVDIQEYEKRTVHGVIATTKGFQRGARQLLKYYGMDYFLVKSVDDFVLQYKGHAALGIQGALATAQPGEVTVRVSKA